MRSCAPGAQRARVDDDACITTKIHIEEITPRYTTRYDPIEVYSYADDETVRRCAHDAPRGAHDLNPPELG